MSIVNDQHKHIFIHVPKTAGTSMECQPWVGGNGHATANHYHVALGDEDFRKYFSWGFVRNPFDRLLSVHSAVWQHPDHCKVRDVVPKDFAEFVHKLPELAFPHIYPMFLYLCDGDGKILVDFVGRYETLNQDWLRACRTIGVSHHRLCHKNSTKHEEWRACYTKELLQIVGEHYRRDFDIFGYPRL